MWQWVPLAGSDGCIITLCADAGDQVALCMPGMRPPEPPTVDPRDVGSALVPASVSVATWSGVRLQERSMGKRSPWPLRSDAVLRLHCVTAKQKDLQDHNPSYLQSPYAKPLTLPLGALVKKTGKLSSFHS